MSEPEVVSAHSRGGVFRGGVFDSEEVRRLALAFEAAWARAEALSLIGSAADPAPLREVIAKRIVETATNGERDPERLVEDALRHVAERAAGGGAAGQITGVG